MRSTMMRTLLMTAVLLMGGFTVLGGTASADDVYECSREDTVVDEDGASASYGHYLCAYDNESGDDSICDGGGGWGWYTARTGTSGGVDQGVQAGETATFVEYDHRVEGEKECTPFRANSDAIQGGLSVGTSDGSVDVDSEWNQDTLYVTVDENGIGEIGEVAFVMWGYGQYGLQDECSTLVEIEGTAIIDNGCPAGGPPASPNPGWGNVAPDVPE